MGLSSCTTAYYYPTNQNVLKFKEEGDVNASYAMDGRGYSTYALGYSFTDNIAFVSDYKTFHTYSSGSDAKYKVGDFAWDNELVLYKKFEQNVIPAINIGYGFGEIDRNAYDYKLGFNRQFIQPSVGYSNDYFDCAFSVRFSRVHHNLKQSKNFQPTGNMTFEEMYDFYDIGKTDFYFSEPALTLGFGYKWIKLRYQRIYVNKMSLGEIKYIDKNSIFSLNVIMNINNVAAKNEK